MTVRGQLEPYLDSLACGTLIWDSRTGFVYANEKASELYMLPSAHLRGRTPLMDVGARMLTTDGKELDVPDMPVETVSRTKRALHAQEFVLQFPDGTVRWLQGSFVPKLAGGRVRQVIASVIDVTAARIQLNLSERLENTVLQSINDVRISLEDLARAPEIGDYEARIQWAAEALRDAALELRTSLSLAALLGDDL